MNFRTFKYTFWHFQFKEFLEIYNRTTERCFRDCIVDLSRRDLTTEEDKCLDDCTTKLTKLNHRLLGTFMVEQPRFTQKKYVSVCISKWFIRQWFTKCQFYVWNHKIPKCFIWNPIKSLTHFLYIDFWYICMNQRTRLSWLQVI